MEATEFNRNLKKGILLCLYGGILFWLLEYLINVIIKSNFSFNNILLGLFIYTFSSIVYALFLGAILLFLYKLKKSLIKKVNILSFFCAIYISTILFLFSAFHINVRFLSLDHFISSILGNIGLTFIFLMLFIFLYFLLRKIDNEINVSFTFIALAVSVYVFLFFGLYINKAFLTTISTIWKVIKVNLSLLLGATFIFIVLYYILQLLYKKIYKKLSFSLKKKLGISVALIILMCVISLFLKENYPIFINPNNIEFRSIKRYHSPNIVLITIDALRADHLSCYGNNKINTKNIDSLAEEGVLFENAISQSPWTAPSIASLFTSLYPSAHKGGEIKWKKGEITFRKIRASSPSLAEILKNNGYITSAIVTNAYLNEIYGFNKGFKKFVNLDLQTHWGKNPFYMQLSNFIFKEIDYIHTPADIVTDEAISWLEDNHHELFFLWIHYMDPHFPYTPPAKYKDRIDYNGKLISNNLKDNLSSIKRGSLNLNVKDKEYLKSLYGCEIKFTDEQIGRLMQKLKDLNVFNNTIIIITSDHGEEFWEHGSCDHGHSVYNELLHVPLIFHFDDSDTFEAKRIKEQIRLIDIFPTIVDMRIADYKGLIQGKSLLPLILSEDKKNRIAFSEYARYHEEKKSIILYYYKYIYYAETKNEELYDLHSDLHELYNLIDQFPEIASKMNLQLMQIINNSENLGKILSKKEDEIPVVLNGKIKEKLKSLGYIQ